MTSYRSHIQGRPAPAKASLAGSGRPPLHWHGAGPTMANYRGQPMPNEEAILEVAGLLVDGVAVSEALLAGDVVEARFRARLVADYAATYGMTHVHVAAAEVVRLLGNADHPPVADYARAVLDLSRELDQALVLLRA